MHAEIQILCQCDREIYVAPQSEVTKFLDKPQTSADIKAEEWATEVRMILDTQNKLVSNQEC